MIKKQIISNNIIKGFKMEIKSAVGIVFDKDNNILMGKAVCDDERNDKWVFMGGGVDAGESPLQAAIREVYEEGGLAVTAITSQMIVHPAKPAVAFFILRCSESMPKITFNEEFCEAKWFKLNKMPKDSLPLNVDILKNIK